MTSNPYLLPFLAFSLGSGPANANISHSPAGERETLLVYFPRVCYILLNPVTDGTFITMDKQKKTFLIGGLIEGAILIFDLVISILVWTRLPDPQAVVSNYQDLCIEKNGAFIGYLQANPTVFFCVICIPLFAMIAVDFIYFAILASKKESKLSDAQLEAIKAKAKAQAEAELRKEMEEEALKEIEGENADK